MIFDMLRGEQQLAKQICMCSVLPSFNSQWHQQTTIQTNILTGGRFHPPPPACEAAWWRVRWQAKQLHHCITTQRTGRGPGLFWGSPFVDVSLQMALPEPGCCCRSPAMQHRTPGTAGGQCHSAAQLRCPRCSPRRRGLGAETEWISRAGREAQAQECGIIRNGHSL